MVNRNPAIDNCYKCICRSKADTFSGLPELPYKEIFDQKRATAYNDGNNTTGVLHAKSEDKIETVTKITFSHVGE